MDPYNFGGQNPDPPQTQNSGAVDAQNGAIKGRGRSQMVALNEAVEGM